MATLLQPEKLLFGSLRNIRPGAIFSMIEVFFKDSRGVGGVLGTASPRSVTRYSREVEDEDKPRGLFSDSSRFGDRECCGFLSAFSEVDWPLQLIFESELALGQFCKITALWNR